ncbi:MAG: hypothetical protein ABS70_04580 [Nitrospira sp. SCN 59-13]|nr:MAG: hypothetical protein ABS70_04580 [Nitrospira sp. SCN 59-13]
MRSREEDIHEVQHTIARGADGIRIVILSESISKMIARHAAWKHHRSNISPLKHLRPESGSFCIAELV